MQFLSAVGLCSQSHKLCLVDSWDSFLTPQGGLQVVVLCWKHTRVWLKSLGVHELMIVFSSPGAANIIRLRCCTHSALVTVLGINELVTEILLASQLCPGLKNKLPASFKLIWFTMRKNAWIGRSCTALLVCVWWVPYYSKQLAVVASRWTQQVIWLRCDVVHSQHNTCTWSCIFFQLKKVELLLRLKGVLMRVTQFKTVVENLKNGIPLLEHRRVASSKHMRRSRAFNQNAMHEVLSSTPAW